MIKMNQEYLEFVKALRPIDDIFMKVIFNDQHCIELLFNIIFEEDISITEWHIQDEYRNLHGRTVIMDIVASTENGIAVCHMSMRNGKSYLRFMSFSYVKRMF